jgi:hypothetical protein
MAGSDRAWRRRVMMAAGIVKSVAKIFGVIDNGHDNRNSV